MWSLRIALARLRPLNAARVVQLAVVGVVMAGFLYGDFRLFARLFAAIAKVEAATPLFTIGLLRNLLGLVFLVATVVLFSSALTASIGAFFVDLDLDLYHSSPRPALRIALLRWAKTLVESASVVFIFLVPLFVAFGRQYHIGSAFHAIAAAHLLVLLTIPVSLAATAILLLVRFFPVRRVHQIVATLAIIVLTLAVTAFRMSRPERFFADAGTDETVRVLQAIELPSMDAYPSTALADLLAQQASISVARAGPLHRSILRGEATGGGAGALQLPPSSLRLALTALASFVLFAAIAKMVYFRAFVRARETMAPVAIGSAAATRILDRLLAPFDAQTRALAAKEIRILGRDVAQWSQLFMMAALLFIYLYNIRILPLGGDARATLVAYANLGMAGFVIAAICLRFAYPSISAEGKAFWLIRGAPISYRRLLIVKVGVYATPLTLLALLLTSFANAILGARLIVWCFTLAGASLLAVTLVSLGVGMGSLSPDFGAENPLQVGLSLGGFAYMAISLAYVAAVMLLMARPLMHYFLFRFFGGDEHAAITAVLPVAAALLLSIALTVLPLAVAERRLAHRD